MTTRRKLLLAFASSTLAAHLPAFAQQPTRVRRIGFLSGAVVQANASQLLAFKAGMTELHWVEGRDYVIDARYANGIAQALPGLAAALVATQPDLLLTVGDAAARLLMQGNRTIPIVFGRAQDPVGSGIAASLQRPAGNATGLASLSSDLSAKRLQLLKEAFPRLGHVVLLFEPASVGSVLEAKEIEEAAARLGTRVTPLGLRQPADIEPALKRGVSLGAQAFVLMQGALVTSAVRTFAGRINRLKLPSIAANTEYPIAGGLMSYASSGDDNFRRAAAYVDKIFKGAKPGDLPIEQPTQFELVINMKTAKAMGISIPQSFLLRADRVIE